MELPPYRLPTFSSVLVHTWQRGRHFLTRAGTVILGVVFLVWLAGSLPWGVPYASADSLIGKIGGFIAPIFQPAGFGEWQASASLIFGVLAKEVIVGTMGAIFGAGGGALSAAVGNELGWSSLNAASFLVFSLLYTPCAASIATLRLETGSWKWTLFTMLYTALVGWILATLVFQIGSIFVTA
jgi:ferrous iron transport protein B